MEGPPRGVHIPRLRDLCAEIRHPCEDRMCKTEKTTFLTRAPNACVVNSVVVELFPFPGATGAYVLDYVSLFTAISSTGNTVCVCVFVWD